MRHLPLISCLILAGCTPTVQPASFIAPPPAVAAQVSPAVAIARQEASKAGAVAARLETQVESLQVATSDLRDGMDVALAEAARLATAKVATEKELDGLWSMLTKETERTKALFAAVEQANASALEHREARLIAEKRIDDLVKIAADKDNEATALREESTALRTAVEAAAAYRAKQDKQILALQADAVLGKQLKIAIIIVASSLGLGLALWIGLKFLKPF